MRTLLIAGVALMVVMAGCIGPFRKKTQDADLQEDQFSSLVGNQTAQAIQEAAANIFRNYTVAGQAELAAHIMYVNGTIAPGQGVTGIEDRNDRSGNNWMTELVVQDLSSMAPNGQPVEMNVKLFYFGQPGKSAELDIYVNVPGLKTEFATDDSDEFNWKASVQEMTVNTAGATGQPFEVGVQIANGRALAEPLDYTLRVEMRFAKDVITPYFPYELTVPPNATALVFTSEKAGGDEHIRSTVLVIDPEDNLLEVVNYDDIALATESLRVPVPGPGDYVVYAVNMTGGFLGVETDVPLDAATRPMRVLERTEESVTDFSGAAPGWEDHYALGAPRSEGTSVSFDVSGAFPLAIVPWIDGSSGSIEANVDVMITGPVGLVAKLQRFGKVEDSNGQLGLSRDELNLYYDPTKLARGTYTVSIVNDGNADVGHTLVTYRR